MKIEFFLKNNRDPEALILLSFIVKKSKEYLLTHPDQKINLWQKVKFFYFWKKFQVGTPLAYLTGHKEFFNLDFLVNKHTLIPRPDTETLVDSCIDEISNNSLLIDVGTGTGCIPITILKRLQDLNITAIATDISKEALKIAKKNAKKHGASIKFLHGNLLSPVFQFIKSFESFKSVVITANLPYLKEEWWVREPSIQQEPKSALVSDTINGLALYEKLLQQIAVNLSTFNFQLSTFLEIDPRQSSAIFPLVQKYLPEADIEIIKDLNGFDRVVKIKIF